MKVAIVHDWLVTYAGAEKVLTELINIFPDADLFSIVDFLDENDRKFINYKNVNTSFIQNLPFAKKKYRNYLAFMPLAIEQFDLSSYDLIVSSSHAVAKGVITGPNQKHVSYVHSPIRYAWDMQHQYLLESNLSTGIKGWVAKAILHYIRNWDYRTANGVDLFLSNSNFIGKRIKKVYGRNSTTVYPPVKVHQNIELEEDENNKLEEYYFTASRMVPYKKIDLIVKSFKYIPNKKLIVIGDGPDFQKIKKYAGTNVELLGYQSDEILRKYMKNAKAFIFAAEEDFGITPVEAQLYGTPVIAFGKGGALETVIGLNHEKNISEKMKSTGVFFYEQSTDSIIKSIEYFEENIGEFDKKNIHKHALKFSGKNFSTNFKKAIENIL